MASAEVEDIKRHMDVVAGKMLAELREVTERVVANAKRGLEREKRAGLEQPDEQVERGGPKQRP